MRSTMPTPTLVYMNALATGAREFLTTLNTLITNPFSASNPRGLGWSSFFNGGDGYGSTTLSSAINSSVTTIPVVDTTGFASPTGTIIIDSEQISYTGVTPTSFTGCLRGANQTTAASHLINANVDALMDKLYFSLGFGASERLWVRLTASLDDGYIDRTICQFARNTDGKMLAPRGDSTTRIALGNSQFEWWLVGNEDFFYLVTLVGSTYSHYYSGNINRFAPPQVSSVYGLTAPSPSNTNTPLPAPFTIGTNTTLFLRTGFDDHGGYDASNQSFVPGQVLYIIDQSMGTSTENNQGVVLLNSVNLVQNSINVTYLSGSTSYSSFAIISVDPQPNALSSNGTIRGNPFLMLDDFAGEATPLFNAVNEFAPGTGLPPEGIQNPDSRGVYVTYPIRLSNTQEIRGTLYGAIDTPLGAIGDQDVLQTFDGLYRFVNFTDGSLTIAIGSII